jgi:hypothetical protein
MMRLVNSLKCRTINFLGCYFPGTDAIFSIRCGPSAAPLEELKD